MKQTNKSQEMDYKSHFCLKYFGKTGWRLDVDRVDVRLDNPNGRPLLYIEAKDKISSEGEERRKAIAQAILTNKKQELPLGRIAILYYDTKHERDMLELIECDDDVNNCHEVNWDKEKPSEPTDDAVFHLNNRVTGKITSYKGEDEIMAFWKGFKRTRQTAIRITQRNCKFVFSQWKAEVSFSRKNLDEQTLVDLFLADMLNNAKYTENVGGLEYDMIRNNTNLNFYKVQPNGIAYKEHWYEFANQRAHDDFWKRYYRPPVKEEFLKIKEHSNELHSEAFRKSTGGEYTPSSFVWLQDELIARHYDMNDYIVFDPCAGVGNLQMGFGRDYRDYCYLSTLLPGDVDQCKLKGFNNAVVFDYMKCWHDSPDRQPTFLYKGQEKTVSEIANLESRKLMVVMNPPYIRPSEGFRYDRCIEFFRKVLRLQPEVIVYYCKTEFFFRQETCKVFEDSGYKIREHVISNAKTTFRLNAWPISLVIFDRANGEQVSIEHTRVDRYELEEGTMVFKGKYDYNNARPDLISSIKDKLVDRAYGLRLGQWTMQSYCIVLSNRQSHNKLVTTENLRLALILKGINFNTHPKYYERNDLTLRGSVDDIDKELADDAIIHALFYKGNDFSNKEGERNYIMPFTAEELGCGRNELYVLFTPNNDSIPFPHGEEELRPFDFREWMRQEVQMSDEACALYNAALDIARYYHGHSAYANGRNWNDSFYDIKASIMGREASAWQDYGAEDDRRVTRVKVVKGLGFSKTNIRTVVGEEYWPMFDRFFEVQRTLVKKINRRLLELNLLLWEHENDF